jgi:putative nucleotidyltransferase with HDIG domain
MDELDRERIDRITEVIYRLQKGLPIRLIDMQQQGDEEVAQLSGFINQLLIDLQSVTAAIADIGSGRFNTPIASTLPIAHSTKSIQATMRHLIWQTEQVAKGDFSQRVNFLGSFSSSFNWMVEELESNRNDLESKVGARTRELSLLLDATVQMSKTHDLDLILEDFSYTLLESFTYHTSCLVALFDPDGQTFRIHKTRSLRPVQYTPDAHREYKVSDFPFLEQIIENRESKIVFKEHARMQHSEELFLFGKEYNSTLVLAFYDGHARLGFVLVSEARDPARSTFTADDLGFYKTLTNHLSVSIKNSLLFKRNKDNFINTIEALAASIDARDAYTHYHSTNVMHYSVKIAEEIGFSEVRIERLSMACLLHDIGKIGIRDAVLLKPGRLSTEEFEEIKEHPEKAAKILSAVKELDPVAEMILAHHERFDGSGYPNGLAGSNIPLESRIMSIADTFDAMTTSRVYRKAKSFQNAIDEINACAGTQFDPEIVRIFMKVAPSLLVEDT